SGKEMGDAVPYKPVPPELMYVAPDELDRLAADRLSVDFTAFDTPGSSARAVFHADSHAGRSFAEERADPKVNVFGVTVDHIAALRASGRRVMVAAWSEGSLDRLGQILADHGLGGTATVDSLAALERLPAQQVGFAVLPLETGFEAGDLTVIAEQDVLGDRLVRRRRKRAAN